MEDRYRSGASLPGGLEGHLPSAGRRADTLPRHALPAQEAVQDSAMGLSDLTASGGVPKGGKGTPEMSALLRQLLWEQRQMNIMMWTTLSPEQRKEVTLYTDHARARWSEDQDPRISSEDA